MAHKSTHRGFDVWTIRARGGESSATFVPELGASGSSLILRTANGPRELLYLHDFFWEKRETRTRGGLPFLFPICGRLEREGAAEKYLWEGRGYSMRIHGFSLHVPWRVYGTGKPDEIAMELTDTDVTRARFPFSFVVTLRYRIEPDALYCEFSVKNVSSQAMPWYAGFHPYFLTPPPGLGKERTAVSLHASRRHVYNQSCTEIVGCSDPPAAPISITHPEVNEMLLELGADPCVEILHPDGFRIQQQVSVLSSPPTNHEPPTTNHAPLFPFVQLYTLPDQPFFCAEPWMAPPNTLNHPDRVAMLAPRARARGVYRIRCQS